MKLPIVKWGKLVQKPPFWLPHIKNFPKPEPEHYNRCVLSELNVLWGLRCQFERNGNKEKFEKCVKALQEFKTKRPNWDDFV